MQVIKDFPVVLELDAVLRGQGASPEKMRTRPHLIRMYEQAIKGLASLEPIPSTEKASGVIQHSRFPPAHRREP